MTALSWAMALFPSVVMAGGAGLLMGGLSSGSGGMLLLALAWVYALPLVVFRWHARRHPLREGPSHLQGGPYSPWWGTHQIQLVYIAFPALETVLRLVPGLYSAWLRAWGSDIGREVYWTPHIRVADRSLLAVGDGVIFGYDVGISSHLVKKTRKNVLLYVKRVRIDDGAFIGAGCIIGPGAHIEAGAVLDAGAHVYPNERVPAGAKVRGPGKAA